MSIDLTTIGSVVGSGGSIDYFMTGIMDVTVGNNSTSYVNLSLSAYNSDYDGYLIRCFSREHGYNNKHMYFTMNYDGNSYRYTSGQNGYTTGSTPYLQQGGSGGSYGTIPYACNTSSMTTDYWAWTDLWMSKKYRDSSANCGTEWMYEGRGASQSGGGFMAMGWGRYNIDTTEVTSVQLYCGSIYSYWKQNSKVTVYGIKYGS